MFVSLIPKTERKKYKAHVYLYSFFPDLSPDAERPFVFRETKDSYLMLSRVKPAAPCINLLNQISAGSVYAYDLICCPQRGMHDGKKRRPNQRTLYTEEKELKEWFQRQMADSATVEYLTSTVLKPVHAYKSGHKMSFHRVNLIGSFKVTDRSNFINKVSKGVGPKGFMGFGMLVMPSIMSEVINAKYEAA